MTARRHPLAALVVGLAKPDRDSLELLAARMRRAKEEPGCDDRS
jgi:hypothetical protein